MKLTEAEACAILELEPGADKPTIRQAYLDVVNVWHPDRFKGNPRLEAKAQEKLKQINAAYERLHPLAEQTARPVGRSRPARKAPAPPTPRERRSSPRVKLRMPVHFRSKRDLGFQSALDISRGGIAIGTPQPLDRHETIPLRFRVPGTSSHIFAEARVVWVSPGIGMGLQFRDLKPADQAVIAAFVDGHGSAKGIVTACSQCGAVLSVGLGDLGRAVRGPCGHTFTVP